MSLTSVVRPSVLPLAIVALSCALATGTAAQELTPELYGDLTWRHIGPAGNRTSAVVGVPGDPMTYYVGASSGGVWKSVDGGWNWKSMFDDQEAQSIGALAIAPSDPNVVWAGTGEAFIRSNVSIGNGVYRSTDAGRTWKHKGLEKTGRIGRVVIDPRNPDVVLVAALGHCYGPQRERGIFRTTDGGETWEHVLFVDENTGCFEIAMSPANPRLLLAGTWPIEIKTYGRTSGGPGGGIYRSRDGGATWERVEGHGLPAPPIGKVGLAFAPSNPDVAYAILETGAPNRGVLWRSENGGEDWKLVSYDRLLNERPHYASRIMVNPADEDEVYFAANSHSITYDGGQTTERSGWSGDAHDMWADPLLPDRMMISDDGGVLITMNRGDTWNRIRLPIAQMYHVAVDDRIPYYVYGGMQDGTGYRGPSTARVRAGRSAPDWESTAGGECGFVLPDPSDPEIVWGGSYNAGFTRVDYRTGHQRTVKVWPESAYGAAAKDVRYRFNWTFPIAISPHDSRRVYAGSQFVHLTTDEGRSWQIISPDLTTNDRTKMEPSGGLTKDNLAVEYGCTLFALAESPLVEGLLWAGSNDGLLHVTRDGGATWHDVSAHVPGLPVWGTISNIEPSRHAAGTAYVTVDGHQMNDRDPHVYRTTDYGATWTSLAANLPRSVFSYCHWIHEDPVRAGLLFLGTENALYVSFDDGGRWLPLQNNLPHAPVHHVVVQERFRDLVVATYGRGFWILEDITPLRQLTDEVLAEDVHLFTPRTAYRLHPITGGPAVRVGAPLSYFLGAEQEGGVQLTITDEAGRLVRTLAGAGKRGINRVTWNLRHEGARQAVLRLVPPGNPRVVEEKRFRTQWEREGSYPIRSWGTGGGFVGITVAPGRYTVTLKAGNTELSTPLIVEMDPRSTGTPDVVRELVEMQLALRDDIEEATGMIDTMELLRRQLADLQRLWKGDASAAGIRKAAKELDASLAAVEDLVLQPVVREGDSKSFRYPNLLYSKLSVLAGNVAANLDESPNAQQREVHALLRNQLATRKAELDALLATKVRAFNEELRQQGRAGLSVPEQSEATTRTR